MECDLQSDNRSPKGFCTVVKLLRRPQWAVGTWGRSYWELFLGQWQTPEDGPVKFKQSREKEQQMLKENIRSSHVRTQVICG
jgi:hypothetical protein